MIPTPSSTALARISLRISRSLRRPFLIIFWLMSVAGTAILIMTLFDALRLSGFPKPPAKSFENILDWFPGDILVLSLITLIAAQAGRWMIRQADWNGPSYGPPAQRENLIHPGPPTFAEPTPPPLCGPAQEELMAGYGITRIPADWFLYKSYRYSTLADALAQAMRDTPLS